MKAEGKKVVSTPTIYQLMHIESHTLTGLTGVRFNKTDLLQKGDTPDRNSILNEVNQRQKSNSFKLGRSRDN